VLHAVRGQQIEHQLAAGPLWQSTGHVLTQVDGRPVNPVKVTQEFTALVRKAALPHLTLHGLRHAHATLLLTAGVHPKVVSERLGHSNIAITMDTYSHVMPGLQEEAVLALDARVTIKRTAATNHMGRNVHEMSTKSTGPDPTGQARVVILDTKSPAE
jgi:integrase